MPSRTILAVLLFIAIWSTTARLTAEQADAALVAEQVESLVGRCDSAADERNASSESQPMLAAVAAVASVAQMPEPALNRPLFSPGRDRTDCPVADSPGGFQPSHAFKVDIPLLI